MGTLQIGMRFFAVGSVAARTLAYTVERIDPGNEGYIAMKQPSWFIRGLIPILVVGVACLGLGSPAQAASPKVGTPCSEKERGKVIQTKSMKASKSYVVCEWVNEDPHGHHDEDKEAHAAGVEPYEGLQWVARGIINVPAAAGLKPSLVKKIKTSDQLYKVLRSRFRYYEMLRPRLETDRCKIQGRKAGYGDTDTAGRRGFPIYEMRNDPNYDRYPRMIDDGWTPTSGDIKIFVAVTAPSNALLGRDPSTGEVTTVTYVLEESRNRMIDDNGSRNLSAWPALADFDEPVAGQPGKFTRTIDVQGLNRLINKRFFDLTEQTSIASFVAEQSYGRALVSGDIGVIQQDPLEGTTTLIMGKDADGKKKAPSEKEQQVAWRAFEAAERSGVDFSQYTQLASLQLGNNDTNWNLQSWRSSYGGVDSHITLNGKRFRNAFTVSEGKDANMAANVISHEFGHATGMADTYGQETVAMSGLGWMDIALTGTFGWTRYIHRWLKDYEVECVPFRENDGPILAKARNQQRQGWYGNDGFSKVVKLAPIQEHLTPQEAKSRKHMIVIPLSDTYNYLAQDLADDFGGGQLSDQEIFDRQARVRPRNEYAAMYSDDKIGTDALIIENWQSIGSSAALTTQGRSMGVRGYIINADDANSNQGWRLSSSSEKAQLAGNYEERRWITHLRDGAQFYNTAGSTRSQRKAAVDDGVLDQRGQKIQFIYSAPRMFWDSDDRCDRRIQVELLDQPSGSAPDLRVRVSIDVADVTGSCEAPSSWGDPSVHSLAP